MVAEMSALIGILDKCMTDFTTDINFTVAPYAIEALAALEDGELEYVLSLHGWSKQCSCFVAPVDMRALKSHLRSITFQNLAEIGRGSYAVVYRAMDRLTGEVVVLKKMHMATDSAGRPSGLPAHAVREIAVLSDLRHPNIVQLREFFWDQERLFFAMQSLDMDLHQYMDSCPQASSLENIKFILWQILCGLQYAHSRRVLHRDLKPQNVLVDCSSGNIKLADFGMARCTTPPLRPYSHRVVTLLYRAPEILLGSQQYSFAVDIWSVGCVFAELVNAVPLFLGDSEVGQLFQIFQVLGTPTEELWSGVTSLRDWQPVFPTWPPKAMEKVVPRLDPQGVDLLRLMLMYSPNARITAQAALQHPYFDSLRRQQGAMASLAQAKRCLAFEAPAVAALPHHGTATCH